MDDRAADQLAEAISSQWLHIKRVLTTETALGAEWEAEIENAEGAFMVRDDGGLLARFGDADYALNVSDGSVLVIREQAGRTIGRTYSADGELVAEHNRAGPLQPDLN